MTTAESSYVHPFERAGLGKAPFHVVRYERRVYRAAPDAPAQPGSTCRYCGQGIMNTFEVAASDGKRFVVGPDCVDRTHDTALREECRKLERAYLAEQSAAARARADESERVSREERRRLARVEAERDNAMLLAGLRVVAADGRSDFAKSFAAEQIERVLGGARMTDAQTELASALYHETVAPHADAYLATAGDKVDVEVTYIRSVRLEGAYGVTWVHRFVDDRGHALSWKTASRGPVYPTKLTSGDRFRLAATVKGHAVRHDEKVTELVRCKMTEVA